MIALNIILLLILLVMIAIYDVKIKQLEVMKELKDVLNLMRLKGTPMKIYNVKGEPPHDA